MKLPIPTLTLFVLFFALNISTAQRCKLRIFCIQQKTISSSCNSCVKLSDQQLHAIQSIQENIKSIFDLHNQLNITPRTTYNITIDTSANLVEFIGCLFQDVNSLSIDQEIKNKLFDKLIETAAQSQHYIKLCNSISPKHLHY